MQHQHQFVDFSDGISLRTNGDLQFELYSLKIVCILIHANKLNTYSLLLIYSFANELNINVHFMNQKMVSPKCHNIIFAIFSRNFRIVFIAWNEKEFFRDIL